MQRFLIVLILVLSTVPAYAGRLRDRNACRDGQCPAAVASPAAAAESPAAAAADKGDAAGVLGKAFAKARAMKSQGVPQAKIRQQLFADIQKAHAANPKLNWLSAIEQIIAFLKTLFGDKLA